MPLEKSVLDALMGYVEHQTSDHFLRLREAVAASPAYAPYGSDPSEVREFMERGEFAQAKERLVTILQGCFLSPSAHRLLAFIHHKLGDEKSAGVEFGMFQ